MCSALCDYCDNYLLGGMTMIVIEIIRVWLSHFLGGGDLWKVIRFANEDRIVDGFF